MMAATGSMTNLGSSIMCKRCGKNIAKNYLTCEKCKSMFHQSCARISKDVKVISDSLINCCGVENCVSNNDAFFDAMESVSVDNKVDVSIFTYIVKQKDALIYELQDKIKVLNDQIELLNKFNKYKSEHFAVSKPSVVEKTRSDKIAKNTNKNLSADTQVDKDSSKMQKVLLDHKEQKVKVNEPYLQINKNAKQISAELLNIQSELKCNEIINLTNDIQTNTSSCSNDEFHKNVENQWSVATYNKPTNRRRKMIVGSNKDSSIKGIRKFVHLHVCRIDLGTTASDLQELLKNSFSEVLCESIKPKYPNLYSSFKVSIFEENFRNAMNPKIWPDGACISRFFQKRTTMPLVT